MNKFVSKIGKEREREREIHILFEKETMSPFEYATYGMLMLHNGSAFSTQYQTKVL
jgi:hypothetical protein